MSPKKEGQLERYLLRAHMVSGKCTDLKVAPASWDSLKKERYLGSSLQYKCSGWLYVFSVTVETVSVMYVQVVCEVNALLMWMFCQHGCVFKCRAFELVRKLHIALWWLEPALLLVLRRRESRNLLSQDLFSKVSVPVSVGLGWVPKVNVYINFW